MSLIVQLIPRPLDGPVTAPDPADPVARGRYLSVIGGCRDCHTPRDAKGKPIEARAYTGGWEMRGPWGRVVTSNLTPHPRAWMGQATRAAFVGRFQSFAEYDAQSAPKAAPGSNTVMPWIAYAGMTEADLGAIYDFLRTLAPIENEVVSFPDAPAGTGAPVPAP